MKSNINMKILKLSIAEIVMQCGFERISEQALNILGDLLKFYIEQVFLRINKMEEAHASFDCAAKAIINDFITEESYQEKELLSFLHTQLVQKKVLGDKIEDDSLLHTLKIIPKSVDLTNVCRNTNSFSQIPNIKNGSSSVSLEVDSEMDKFINSCLSEKNRREKVGEYKFNLLEIINKEREVERSILVDFESKEKRMVFRR